MGGWHSTLCKWGAFLSIPAKYENSWRHNFRPRRELFRFDGPILRVLGTFTVAKKDRGYVQSVQRKFEEKGRIFIAKRKLRQGIAIQSSLSREYAGRLKGSRFVTLVTMDVSVSSLRLQVSAVLAS